MQTSEILPLVAFTVWAGVYVLRLGRREPGLPPGPPTTPVLGNAHLLGGKDLHLKITEWARYYGDVFSIKIGSGTMVVLSSPAAIKEVVDKHGWVGSSRPNNYIAELCGSGEQSSILFANGPRLHTLRRTLARFFSPQNSLRYRPAQAAESTLLLHDLITHPEDFSDSIRRFSHSLAKIITYGQRAPNFHAPDVLAFYSSLDGMIHALAPGRYPPFELFPVFKYLPPPFAPWRAACQKVKSVRAEIQTSLWESLRRRQAAGDEESFDCAIGELMHQGPPPGEEHFYSYTGIGLLDAGSDTSAAFLLSLVLVLSLYPECQERARKEIDAIIGPTRLPVAEDGAKLPYLNALIREVLRFRPQFPLGIPHMLSDSIVYKDHFLPKGSKLMLNTYAIFHDPEIFENPEVFNPDRFLTSEYGTRPGMDADFRDNFLFGGGRRICIGQWIGRSTMQITAMRLIWALKFADARDPATDKPLSRDLDTYAHNFVVMPRPFKCKIEPRSAEYRDVIVQAQEDAKHYLSRFEPK
ncbi:cytochrome P450 [Mycena metata]|uniref:Cytochrome P450 n=1 Tax=Mycena metata TaxID=1033252 RepID=A0AAD7NN81_9AGAR|nr:cytochrome P450 [Mycena metata]